MHSLIPLAVLKQVKALFLVLIGEIVHSLIPLAVLKRVYVKNLELVIKHCAQLDTACGIETNCVDLGVQL